MTFSASLPAFDAYALSSDATLGLSVIEAFAAQLPVVATSVGGVPEIVIHDETGWLVEPESPEALARGIGHSLAPRKSAACWPKPGDICNETQPDRSPSRWSRRWLFTNAAWTRPDTHEAPQPP